MELGRVLSLFVAMLLAYGLSVAATNLLAAAYLIQFLILTAVEYDSEPHPIAARGLRGGVLVVEAGTPSRRLAPSVVTVARVSAGRPMDAISSCTHSDRTHQG
jgi:hypothetical protein